MELNDRDNLVEVWESINSLADEHKLPFYEGAEKKGFVAFELGEHGQFAFRAQGNTVAVHWGQPVAQPEDYLATPASLVRNGTSDEIAHRIFTDCVSMAIARETAEDLGLQYDPSRPFNAGPYLVSTEIKRKGLHKTLADTSGEVVATNDMEGFPDWRAEARRLFVKSGRTVHAPAALPDVPSVPHLKVLSAPEGQGVDKQR